MKKAKFFIQTFLAMAFILIISGIDGKTFADNSHRASFSVPGLTIDKNSRQNLTVKTAKQDQNQRKIKTDTAKIDKNSVSSQITQAITGIQSKSRSLAKRAPIITEDQSQNLSALSETSEGGVRAYFNSQNGTPAFIQGNMNLRTGSLARSADRSALAMSFMSENRKLFKLANPEKELSLNRQETDEYGKTHIRYQQTFNSVPLWGKELMVHLEDGKGVYLFQGNYAPTPENIQTTPSITLESAKESALQYLSLPASADSDGYLVIYTQENSKDRLAYKIDVSYGTDKRWICFVDAKTAKIIHCINNIQKDIVSAKGSDISGTTQSFNAWSENSVYYVIDPSFPATDSSYDPLNKFNASGDTYVLDARNGDGSQLYFSVSNSRNTDWDSAAVSSIHNMQTVYNYYKNTFGRKGIDNKNKSMLSVIHLKDDYNNAFWNGTLIAFGDGDGRTFSQIAAALDVTAHEMTHGVVEHTAGLIYENQSGALNESFADIFATMVDRNDWLVGEDITKRSPGFLRSLADPKQGLSPQPAHMDEYKRLPNTEDGDNGGVHVNCGIPSRAAYLLAEGLSAEGRGTSIGREKTEKIYYRALTTYLQASSQFLDCRRSLIQSAEDLYGSGSAESSAVKAAWDAVGITEGEVAEPDSVTPTPTDSVQGNDKMAYLYPADKTYNSPDEEFYVYIQTFSKPFQGYDSKKDVILDGPPAFHTRPAVYSEGEETYVMYVGIDNNMYLGYPDTSVKKITSTGDIWSIAISHDGNLFAWTSTSPGDNNIYVLDGNTGKVTEYPITSRDYIEEETISTIYYADALAFDYTDQLIVFDARNCVSLPDNSCTSTGGGYRYWSVGILDLTEGKAYYPFPDQNPDIDLAYPVFASNNDFIIAMDVQDYSLEQPEASVITVNFETQNVMTVAEGIGSWGVPSFWGDDDFVTLQYFRDDIGTYSAMRVPIDSNWAGNISRSEWINDFATAMPVMHRSGLRNLNATIQFSTNLLNFGDVKVGQSKELTVTLTNAGNRDVEISNIYLTGSEFSHNATNTRIARGGAMSVRIRFSPSDYTGSRTGTLSVTSNGEPSTLNLSISGNGVSEEPSDSDDDDGGGGGCFIDSL